MSSLYMMGRLLWRPAGWLLLVLLAVVAVVAGRDLAQSWADMVGGPLDFDSRRRAMRWTLWRLATLLAAIAGSSVSFSARELQHSFFAWTLPSLSRGLQTGKAVIGIVGAILLALFASSMHGGEIAAAVFGWSLLCFVLGGVAFDPVRSRVGSRGVITILALLFLEPGYLDQVILTQPLLFAAVSTLIAGLVLHREFSPDLARKRPLFGVPPSWASTPHGMREFWSRSSAPSREWNEVLAHDRFLNWLRAGYYEAYGGAGGAGTVLFQVAFAMAIAYLLAEPMMIVIMSWIVLGTTATQLRGKFLYPLSRPRRAALFFASTVLETFTIAAIALAAVVVLGALGAPTITSSSNSTVGELASFLTFFVVWAPVGHWAKIRELWIADPSLSSRVALRFFGFHIAYIVLAMVSIHRFREILPTPMPAWVAIGFLGAAVYAIYWLAIQRHFARADLIVPR